MKQDCEKTRKTYYTFSDDGLKKSPVANFVYIRGNRYLHFFPALYIIIVPALVKHTRVGSNWVNGVIIKYTFIRYQYLFNDKYLQHKMLNALS